MNQFTFIRSVQYRPGGIPLSKNPYSSGIFRGPGAFCMILLTTWLVMIMHIYIPNTGGTGPELPQNAVAWCIAAGCILASFAGMLFRRPVVTATPVLPALAAVVLLLLPLAWDPSPLWFAHALMRAAGIVGAFLFFIALLQVPFNEARRRATGKIVLVSAIIQALTAMLQAWLPDLALRVMEFNHISPYGIFQQRNVLASWLATGCGAALWLAVTARHRRNAWLCSLALFPLTAAVVLTESRTGALGVMAMLVIGAAADLLYRRLTRGGLLRRLLLIVLLCLQAFLVSNFAMPGGTDRQANFEHTGSTEQRIRVLKGTWQLIKEHPLSGSGEGSFEHQFPQGLEDSGLVSIESNTFTHPHNEILYVWAEGGVSALAGILLLGGIWLWPVLRQVRRSRTEDTIPAGWLFSLTGLPVILHMQTEYPIYLSVPHLLVMILLFRAGLPAGMLHTLPFRRRHRRSINVVAAVGCILSLAVIVVMSVGQHIQLVLTRNEQALATGEPLPAPFPADSWRTLTQRERLDYDRHMAALLVTWPKTHESQVLTDFSLWGSGWLQVHNSPEVMAAMMMLARRRGDWQEAEKIRQRASRIFVSDNRFTTRGA